MNEGFDIQDVNFKRIRVADAMKLSTMLRAAPSAYSRHFIPFAFDAPSVRAVLRQARKDLFFVLRIGGTWAGFYMLRGFDQGYRIPAYGVWIAPAYQDRGLAALTLAHAFSICKLNGIGRLLLKVHPQNVRALKLYERSGFVRSGVDPRNRNFIYMKSFAVKRRRAGA